MQDFYSMREVAEMFGVSYFTIIRWHQKKILPPPIPIGPQKLYFVKTQIDDYIKDCKKMCRKVAR